VEPEKRNVQNGKIEL